MENRKADLIGIVRSAWRDTLGYEKFNDDIGFFDAGGDSFMLISLIGKLSQSSGLTIRAIDVLRAPTVRNQAELLGQLMSEGQGERQ
ncbi:acyl carrier protein [Streptomyces sp. B1866]|uniref:acyl carrier protein n=1 Tax=Streptomyces sp. B1866 TaxID=3075431 RepID=UPI0028915699|nr:acyl carrier protein [Streptomyces sp. B1866]MDT3399273.1 acyl carrier protein [Streptomyces sp. B1866]